MGHGEAAEVEVVEWPEEQEEQVRVTIKLQLQVKDMGPAAEEGNPLQMQIWEEAAEDMVPHRSQAVQPVPKAV